MRAIERDQQIAVRCPLVRPLHTGAFTSMSGNKWKKKKEQMKKNLTLCQSCQGLYLNVAFILQTM